jgi:2,3-bisphosphoglycerate-dependent phosphoglycerate mutase
VRELVVARHAESEASAKSVLNGDPSLPVGLTPEGREQAKALGRTAGPVDLAAHTAFPRTRETAELAWPAAPLLAVPELNEIQFGQFEGTLWTDGYSDWVVTAGPAEDCPGGGESRVTALRRYVRGFRILLERPEERVALVAHGAQVRYLLLAGERRHPTPLLEFIDPAVPYTFGSRELEAAIELLEQWLASPAF